MHAVAILVHWLSPLNLWSYDSWNTQFWPSWTVMMDGPGRSIMDQNCTFEKFMITWLQITSNLDEIIHPCTLWYSSLYVTSLFQLACTLVGRTSCCIDSKSGWFLLQLLVLPARDPRTDQSELVRGPYQTAWSQKSDFDPWIPAYSKQFDWNCKKYKKWMDSISSLLDAFCLIIHI